MKLVVRLEPLTWTTDPLTNFEPFTGRVKAELPTVVALGEILVSVGTGLLTVKVSAPLVPPGLTTVMERVPAETISLAGMAALSCVLLTKGVLRLDPLSWTTDPLIKFVPFTVRVKAGPPAKVVPGEILVSEGGELLTTRVNAADVPPPGAGFTTETERYPAEAMSLAGMAAVS